MTGLAKNRQSKSNSSSTNKARQWAICQLKIPCRLAIPVLTIVIARLAIVSILYTQLGSGNYVTILPWVSPVSKWIYLFNRWDSSYYYNIAASWYPHHLAAEWAFFPLYPVLIRFLVIFGLHPTHAALIITTLSGLMSTIVYQRIAERYLGPTQGVTSTLLYFTLPPVFVFSAVSYSEPVFLLFSLLAWYLHVTGKDKLAGSAAAICSMSRPSGVLMAVPLALDYIRRREFRKLLYAFFPPFCFLGWIFYSMRMTGTPAAVSALGVYWASYPKLILQTVFDQLLRGNFPGATDAARTFLGLLELNILRVMIGMVAIVLAVILGYKALKIDRSLGIYVITSVVAISYFGIFPSIGSFPRYLGFLFPLGFTLGIKRKRIALLALIVLLTLDFVAWWAFVFDGFY